VWDRRNLIASWPGLALAAAALVTSPRGLLRPMAITLLVGGAALGGVQLLDRTHQRPGYEEAAGFVERTARPGDPVVEIPAPTPGPLSSFGDAALQRLGQGRAERHDHPVLRLGSPSLPTVLAARPYAALPVATPQVVARQAAALARGGRIFLVAPGAVPLAALRGTTPVTAGAAGVEQTFDSPTTSRVIAAVLDQMRPFVAALPPGYRPVAVRAFPGFVPVSVYELRAGG
jgi:hypothetical protein